MLIDSDHPRQCTTALFKTFFDAGNDIGTNQLGFAPFWLGNKSINASDLSIEAFVFKAVDYIRVPGLIRNAGTIIENVDTIQSGMFCNSITQSICKRLNINIIVTVVACGCEYLIKITLFTKLIQ